ncbi:hypothetical protein RB608_27575 [Nocardioides sp. LHD-245]|uniref:hypothetical protein n=1 Tax=Nocardioides sp. LHD-245 TaxID=3051387 RepID=UPI0027DF40E0|nr:hypothetical protein [Nocardioides sp. LHD-245]
MTIEHTVRRGRRQVGRQWLWGTAAGLAGALALVGFPAAPAAADSTDPNAPFELPALYGKPWSDLFSGSADRADYLRTGGVNCPKPAPLAASNAGSGHGYRAPFTMALTDGRVLAGYSPLALQAGQLPFGVSIYGVTGWVRGWVSLPALRVEIPEDGVILCSGSGVSWTSGFNAQAPGTFTGKKVAAATDAPQNTGVYAWTELKPVGTPQAGITGLTPSGALEFSASMKVEVHAMQNRANDPSDNDCTTTVELTLGTTPEPLPTTFAPIEGALPSDPGQWRRRQEYDAYYHDPHDMNSIPPPRYQMPSRALAGALPGRSATVVNGTVTMPALTAPGAPRTGVCGPASPGAGSFGSFLQGLVAPTDLDGRVQPGAVMKGGQPELLTNMLYQAPLYDIPAGSVQTSVDITIADIGMPRGLPTGFGFS